LRAESRLADTTKESSSRQPHSTASAPRRRRTYWLPRTIRPTREGWWLIGATFVVGLAATNTGNNLLYLILAMLLSFLVVSGVLSEQAMRRVRLQREVPRRLFAGYPATFSVRLRNGKHRLPSYALHLTEPDPGGGPAPVQFFMRVGPQEQESWTYALTFPRRGRQYLPGLRLFTRFPFGLFTKGTRPIHDHPVLVYPAVRALARDEVPAALEAGWRERHRRGRGAGLYNLRVYRPGDDPRLLHWKTSARMGDLIVKEQEEEERPRVRIILEDPAADATSETIERDLSYTASVAAHAIRLGAAVELVAGAGSVGFGTGEAHLDRILERLALYAPPAAPRRLQATAGAAREVRVRLGAGRCAGGDA
jgi:uncharacterized protein (DUF58 family)